MLQISAGLLAMSGDAALLVKNGRVAFANNAAFELLGNDCFGKRLADIFGEDIAGAQADTFVAECRLSGREHIVRVCTDHCTKAVFISPAKEQINLISDAFIFSLRSILMSISSSAEAIRNDPKYNSLSYTELSQINYECRKIVRILSNITLIRAYEYDELCLSPASFDLSAFIEETCRSVNWFCRKAQLCFTNPGPVMVRADRVLLEAMLLNLISNCVIHAQGCSRISINLLVKGERIMLSVDDDGCGIAPDALHSIFDRYRHGYGIGDVSHGAGLGLTAARIAARMHGGTVLMESRPGIGTAVRVSMNRESFPGKVFKSPESPVVPGQDSLLTGIVDCLSPEEFAAASADLQQ